MYVIEVIPLVAIQRNQKRIYSFFHAENLPAGSLVEVLVSGKKTKAVAINSQSIKYLKIRLKKEADFELKPIIKVLNKNPAPNFDIALWFPAPKIKEKKTKERPSEERGSGEPSRANPEKVENLLNGYLEKLAERKVASKAKNYMQETAEEYLKYIDWENDSFEEDMRLFWISASNYYKRHTHHDFVKILEWVKKKDSLSPKQVAKLFNKE
ncbi:MAG: hypothetical protein G01um101444_79 [Parcubacteria group bacterium Gr01-1014_44]|nr:MAG: hypothetical protein G01um101444_79 [Parcubacteria group bacterium Gr01-1014_44]